MGHNSKCTLLDARCVLPGTSGLMEYTDLAYLIYDGQNLGILPDEHGQWWPHFTERLLVPLKLKECDSLKGALDIVDNLCCYDLVLTGKLLITAERHFIWQRGQYSMTALTMRGTPGREAFNVSWMVRRMLQVAIKLSSATMYSCLPR